ncbi:MAG: FAD-dependent oxidoreductase, partial [Actinobacteria bacterium]|nr:FAD-dependent oxidoreductase [Actinomycetota bacterium]
MKTNTQVVVIGGGVVGASVLYHLTKLGWTDVVLLERAEYTAGSTWHSAGGMHTLNGDPNVAKLQQYTITLYEEIEKESGMDASMHITGGVMLADTPERMDWLKMSHARGRYLGMETELISAEEAQELLPILDPQYFVGAMWDAHEGHLDPSQITHAYLECARNRGAETHRHSWVRDITRAADGGWDLTVYDPRTDEDKATVHCEHVVNAGGLWAREVGRMVGLETPLLAMEHMYLLTEEIPDVIEYNEKTGKEIIHAVDFGGEIYMRQEGNGLLMGTYERRGKPWSTSQTPWDFGARLLTPDLERIAESLETGFKHFPVFAEAGIKQVINGPFTFAPDGNPLLGPVRGLPGYWSACAVMAGLSQGGGVGLSLANWIVDGDPGFDIWGMDISRYGDYSTMAYTNEKVRENYSRRFRITFPNEFLPAGRGVQTSPIYDRLAAKNAGFSKFKFSGPGARAYLDRILAGRIPNAGRMSLTPMTNPAGNLIGDLTVATLGAATGAAEGPASTITGGATGNTRDGEEFVLFGSGIAERYYERWFDQHLPADGSVRYETLGFEMAGLSIAGPNARAVLEKLTDADGDGFGLEAALWFQQDGEEAVEDVTFGRSNAWD